MQTNDAEVNKLIDKVNAGGHIELLTRDELRKMYRKLDCRLLHGISADDCSKLELINGVKEKLGLFETKASSLAAGVGSVVGSDPLEIPPMLKREVTPETTRRVNEVVKEINGKRAVPKMPATSVTRSYAKSNVETGAKMQKWYFKADPKTQDELPKQARQILSVVKDAGAKGIDRDAIGQTLRGIIKTKQPIDRVVSFYRSKLVGDGYVKID